MVNTIFQSCLAVHGYDNMENLLECATSYMETAHNATKTDMNSFLLIISGALVFFMQAGFAMLCAGSVRKKNTQNTMLKNLLDACGAAIAYFCVGYAFAFGDGDNGGTKTTFIGKENFFGKGDIDLPFYFFQYTFAAASVTIVAGALAERCQMAAYLCYSFFLTGFVYPVVVHAVWSPAGFLSTGNANPLLEIGMVDFAGSGVVHMVGGTTALIATYLLGSRRGRFYDLQTGEALDTPKPMPGHSVSLQMLGSFILWFGWFGFNPGSALLMGDTPYTSTVSALCAVNTFLASSASCISSLFYKLLKGRATTGEGTFDLIAAMNGTLGGLVAITAGCGTLEPWAAIVTGFFSGLLYLWSSDFLIYLKLDDVVDAVPVHFVCGLFGCLITGLLSEPERMRQAYGTDQYPGFFYSLSRGEPDARLLGAQVIGVLFIIGWTFITMTPFFLALNYMGWLRSEAVEELVGLDVCYNGEQVCVESKGESEEGVRNDYMDAYEEYRLAQQKQAKAVAGSNPIPMMNRNHGSQKPLRDTGKEVVKEYVTDDSGSSHELPGADYDETISL